MPANWPIFLLIFVLVGAVGALVYWLVIVTEGVYLGRRVVVWLYDVTAHKYERVKQFDAMAEHHFLVLPLLHRLADLDMPWVLDVAAGTGRLARALVAAETFTGHVIGVDAAGQMLRQGQSLLEGEPQSEQVQGLAARLPFPDAQFPAVTCLEALEFFPSPEAALQEMLRVLRPDGLLLVTRRKGWEARTFLGRYRSPAAFAAWLRAAGLIHIQQMPWQVDYDLVFAVKPLVHLAPASPT